MVQNEEGWHRGGRLRQMVKKTYLYSTKKGTRKKAGRPKSMTPAQKQSHESACEHKRGKTVLNADTPHDQQDTNFAKEQATSRRSSDQVIGQTAEPLQTRNGAAIYHWIRKHSWPNMLFKPDMDMDHKLLDRPSQGGSDSGVATSRANVTEKFPYMTEKCDHFLLSENIWPDDCPEGPVDEDIAAYARLFYSYTWETPKGTVFDDTTFSYVGRQLRQQGELAVMALIAPLIVPLAGVEVLRVRLPFKEVIDCINKPWDASIPLDTNRSPSQPHVAEQQFQLPCPQPAYTAGFSMDAFTDAQLSKLLPLLGEIGDTSYFKGTEMMLFPFFTAEAKCEGRPIQEAERQNMHSMGRALRGIVELFKLAKCEKHIHRRILGYSVAYSHRMVYIHGYYPVITEVTSTAPAKISYHRRTVGEKSITASNGKERWTSYKFVLSLYHDWVPKHHELLCNAIDSLPEWNFGISPLGTLGTPSARSEDTNANA